MYHENLNLIHQIIFISCFLMALISPPYNQGMAWSKETKTTSGSVASWVVETVQIRREKDNTKWFPIQWWQVSSKEMERTWNEKKQCDLDCKINTLTGIGIDIKIAKPLVENCKRIANDPRHCIIAGASIIIAESGGKIKNCPRYNCMGLGGWSFRYTSYEVQIIDWINRYQKYWYKAKSASFFYPAKWEKSKSRYCVSEESSWSTVGCPNGLKHSSNTWNKLSKLF